MKHHPEVLTLLLKRFELDYDSMTYFKINCTVRIPHTLQIPENQTYELYAVVEHFGDLESGHYTACIKSQEEDRWFKFDDARVTELEFQPFQSQNFERSDSAYLLFYRKKSVPPPETQRPENIREEFAPGGCSPSTSDVDQREDAVMVNGGEETEEKAEPGINMKVVDKDRVSVCSEEEVKLPEPHCQDLEIRDYFMQGNHEENDESDDSHLQIQDREKEEVKTPDEEEAEEKDHVSGERPREESERQNVKIMRQGCAQEVCVNTLIENEGNAMEGKREKDRRGWDQGMRVDPAGKQEGGGDTESYREVKQEAEKKVRGEEVKSGPDEEESRSRKPLTKLDLDEKIQDKGAQNRPKDYQGRSSGYESREQHRVEKEHKSHQATDERSSDDNSQEGAYRVRVFVSAAETQRRRHSDAQDRGRSSHSQGALVRSRSLPERQKEVRKSEKQVEPDGGIEEEKQHLKESGICKEEEENKPEVEEMTLETPTRGNRKRKSTTDVLELFRCINLRSKPKKVKITPGVLRHERKAKKRSKDKKKRVKPRPFFSCSRKNQTSESESD
ncbi:uncharacterized protein LOC141784513 [Halichoeres trimaculatus]|uniref:uncharacterized protein LOC141784513 n=1 Tax=Halichoeres trimaculatus TaxID=147232 RepID=UPI003D9EB0F9